jgi:phenylpyruvate tautomerase PptA (4-oxalocrotonate tautomerase family)
MAQVKIFGLRKQLDSIRAELSGTIHRCLVDILQIPPGKRFHRFISLDPEDFLFPDDRSEQYLIIEILMMSGRKPETRKELIRQLFSQISGKLNISVNDIEVCILESPPENWGFRGKTGDEAVIGYKVEV